MDFDELQQVEGFARLISEAGYVPSPDRVGLGPDFRGPSPSASTHEWWRLRDPNEPNLVWETAPVPAAVDTTFTFVGESPNLWENVFPTNRATLYLNDERAVSFDLGIRERFTWTEGDFALQFIPRQIRSTIDGFHRQFLTTGNSGLYKLAAPARVLQAGQPVRLKVVVEPLKSDQRVFFAVRQRTDALEVSPRTNAEQIEQLQRELSQLKRVVGTLARRSYAELFPERLPTEEVLIYQNFRRHVHPPDIEIMPNGDLLVCLREASEHISNDGRILTIRSTDGGRTWGDLQVVCETPYTDEREASLVRLSDGTILMNEWPNPNYDHHGRYQQRPTETYRGRPGGIYIGRSTDNGHTWSFTDRPLDPAPYGFVGSSERIVELPSGRLLMAVYGWNQARNHAASAVFRSDDHGTTWTYHRTIADVPGMRLGEPAMLRTRAGRLISILRNEDSPIGEGGVFWQTFSDDGGDTWSPARRSAIPGTRNPASLVELADGTIICVYGWRGDPAGMYVIASYDQGETWDVANRRVIRDDFTNFDIGYPSTVVLADGVIFTVYNFNLFERYYIAGDFFRWERP